MKMKILNKKEDFKSYPSPLERFSKIERSSPITHHLEEIKIRVFYILFSLFSTFTLSYLFSEEIGYILALPFINLQLDTNLPQDLALRSTSFIYTDMKEVFFTYLGLSFYIAVILVIPISFFHLLGFFSPGLYLFEKKRWSRYFFGSFFLFLMGCLLAYFFLLPSLYQFFLSFEITNFHDPQFLNIHLQPKIQEYFFLAIRLILISGLFSQLPLFLWILLSTNIFPEKISFWILQKRNIAYLVTFFLAAWISPPDILSQFIIAFPWILLYEFTIFLILWKKEYLKIIQDKK